MRGGEKTREERECAMRSCVARPCRWTSEAVDGWGNLGKLV